MLAGAYPIFLETYPLAQHDLYGAIDLAQIKAVMLDLKRQGQLHRLKQITLTNSTFDGLIYHAEKYMMELLALKPDLVFHWDEAWFAFGHFHPLYHSRTAMGAVHKIRSRLQDPQYHAFYSEWKSAFDANPDEGKWLQALFPAPAEVRLRVYATQSTHKTLTAFRQGSMIHVADDVFNAGNFLEAFRIHTSTSPNYQIIASLDIGRRQAALEGFHRVRDTIALSLQLRQRIGASELLSAYFAVLDDAALIPETYRQPGVADSGYTLATLSNQWGYSDLVVDPTRITLNIAKTGMDGTSFRQLLMTRYAIQVNKTSRHTVLFLMNIGATQASVDYLLQVLHEMAASLQSASTQRSAASPAKNTHAGAETKADTKVDSKADTESVALPSKRQYHHAFLPLGPGEYAACDIRQAYFDGFDQASVCYLPLSSDALAGIEAGQQWVSASFVTPYPPGFPVIVPGQIITAEIFHYFQNVKVKEIHGFHAEAGFKVFSEDYLATALRRLRLGNPAT
jgi:arginine decarboxylase